MPPFEPDVPKLKRTLIERLERARLDAAGRCVWFDLDRAGRPRRWRRRRAHDAHRGRGLLFMLPGGRAACLELGRRSSSPEGAELERRCELLGAQHARAGSLREAQQVLVEWGVLVPDERI